MEQRRQLAVILLAVLLIAAFVVMTIDGSQVYVDRRHAQDAADTAVLAGAIAKVRGSKDYSTAAFDHAASNGYNNDGVTNTVQVVSPPIVGPYAGGDEFIQVIITTHFKTKILRLKQENTVTAVAKAIPPPLDANGNPIGPIEPTISLVNGGGPSPSTTPGVDNPVSTELQAIDDLLKQTIKASLAYNRPDSMSLGETTTIELLINPSLFPEQLGAQVTENGAVTTGSVDVTPRMKAILYAPTADGDTHAFEIQPLHDNPEQLVSATETTSWKWSVTALKGGSHPLTLVIYRYIKYEGGDYWREEVAYKSDVLVNVSFRQRLALLDWKWILPTIASAILIPALWRWYDARKKREDEQAEEKPKRKPRSSNTQKVPVKKQDK